jgi:hypothetical protein
MSQMMEDPQLQPGLDGEERSHLWISLAIGAVAVVALLGLVTLFNRGKHVAGPAAVGILPFGAAERAYAQRIQFTDLQMSRAANFLNQEITYINGVALNNGVRRVLAVDVTVDFHDVSGNVIFHENRRLISGPNSAIEAGQRHSFQLGFEAVPDAWNQYYPDLKITGLTLE